MSTDTSNAQAGNQNSSAPSQPHQSTPGVSSSAHQTIPHHQQQAQHMPTASNGSYAPQMHAYAPYQQTQPSYPMSYGANTSATADSAQQQRPYLGYPDQYQQYLQSVQQMGTAGLPTNTGSYQQQNPYSSYYMMNNQIPQQSQPAQQPQQAQSAQQPAQPDYSGYGYRGYMQNYPPNAMYSQAGTANSGVAGGAPGAGSGASNGAAVGASGRASAMNGASNGSSLSSTVGQVQPAGLRPRITTTMWEDEKTLCYQVDANGISVVRRADNNMINGTKLLNVAKMTRGRRDGILKSEKVRKVVKIGSMHLKGVWIPFERALAMAQRESIVDLLYPLFVKDIKRVIQQGTPTTVLNGTSGTPSSTTAVTASIAASNGTANNNGGASSIAPSSNAPTAATSNGSITTAATSQQTNGTPSQQQMSNTPLSSSTAQAQPQAMNNYGNMYYSNQYTDGSAKQQQQQQAAQFSGYYQQQPQAAAAAATTASSAAQPYYYYPGQQQQYANPYSGYGGVAATGAQGQQAPQQPTPGGAVMPPAQAAASAQGPSGDVKK